MGSFFAGFGYFLSHPGKVIEVVANSLLYPTLFIEVGALLWVAYQSGTVAVEAWQRRKARSMLNVESAAANLGDAVRAADPLAISMILGLFDFGPVVGPVVQGLLVRGIQRHRARKMLIDAEQRAVRRLDRTRMFIRLGPVLGLMGTLIPISPALVALAKGDTQTLSTCLIIAFSTTVDGLLIGAIAYITSIARERWYSQDISDLEYVLDRAAV